MYELSDPDRGLPASVYRLRFRWKFVRMARGIRMKKSLVKRIYRGISRKLHGKVLTGDDLEHLVFGRQNYGTQGLFNDIASHYHTVPLSLFPHYQFLDSHLDDPYSENIYRTYLEKDWGYAKKTGFTDDDIKAQIDKFLELYHHTAGQRDLGVKAFDEPITVCPRPDGKIIIVEGNHRAAIALKLKLGLKAIFISPAEYMEEIVDVPEERWGSGRLDLPYQSIFEGRRLLVRGRRPDIYERIMMMDQNDIQSKTILELGCNIGGSCFCALQAGAKSALGVDYSPGIITSAIQLNSYFALPCAFMSHDLNHPLVDAPVADTVFCLSVAAHLQNPDALFETIVNKTGNVLYYEGHAHTQQSDYAALLNEDNFSAIELIGYTRNRVQNKKKNRPLFRCEIKR